MQDHAMYRAVVPLICFNVLEWHHPDRVLMQFGYAQHVPSRPAQDDRLHDISLRGKVERDWSAETRIYIDQWASRHDYVHPVRGEGRRRGPSDEYMQWYRQVTRRWMEPRNAKDDFVVSLLYV